MIASFNKWKKYRFHILFISLMMSIMGNTFVPLKHQNALQSILVIQNVIIALSLYANNKKTIYTYGSIVLVLTITEILKYYVGIHFKIMDIILGFSYIIFYLVISILVFKYIFKSKEYSYGIIFPVFCSYLLLGILATFIFTSIENTMPGSFEGLKDAINLEENMRYFSFTTLLTTGFGDITPVTSPAINATILVGLAGNFYMIFVTGVIIMRYYK